MLPWVLFIISFFAKKGKFKPTKNREKRRYKGKNDSFYNSKTCQNPYLGTFHPHLGTDLLFFKA